MSELKLISAYCAGEQKETSHKLDIDMNGEITLSCISEGCARFLKFPKGTTAETLKEHLAKHKASNEGQVTVEQLEKEKEELLKGFE